MTGGAAATLSVTGGRRSVQVLPAPGRRHDGGHALVVRLRRQLVEQFVVVHEGHQEGARADMAQGPVVVAATTAEPDPVPRHGDGRDDDDLRRADRRGREPGADRLQQAEAAGHQTPGVHRPPQLTTAVRDDRQQHPGAELGVRGRQPAVSGLGGVRYERRDGPDPREAAQQRRGHRRRGGAPLRGRPALAPGAEAFTEGGFGGARVRPGGHRGRLARLPGMPRPNAHSARKADIPVAGMGTRFLPATKAVPKELLPVVDRPALQYIVEEAARAGLPEVLMVTGRNKASIEDFFDRTPELETALETKGDDARLAAVHESTDVAQVFFVRQGEAKGLGHAVLQAAAFVGDEPFAVLLGDDIIDARDLLLEQMLAVQAEHGGAVIALLDVGAENISKYGAVAVEEAKVSGQAAGDDVFRVTGMVDNPPAEETPSSLAIICLYVLPPDVFDALRETPPGRGGEIQLTDALLRLVEDGVPVHGVVFSGRRYDTGDKLDYLKAVVQLAVEREDLGPQVAPWLRDFVTDLPIEGASPACKAAHRAPSEARTVAGRTRPAARSWDRPDDGEDDGGGDERRQHARVVLGRWPGHLPAGPRAGLAGAAAPGEPADHRRAGGGPRHGAGRPGNVRLRPGALPGDRDRGP